MHLKVAAHDVQHLKNQGITHTVEDLAARFAAGNDMLGPQDGKVLGSIGRLQHQPLDNHRNRQLSLPERL